MDIRALNYCKDLENKIVDLAEPVGCPAIIKNLLSSLNERIMLGKDYEVYDIIITLRNIGNYFSRVTKVTKEERAKSVILSVYLSFVQSSSDYRDANFEKSELFTECYEGDLSEDLNELNKADMAQSQHIIRDYFNDNQYDDYILMSHSAATTHLLYKD